MHISKKGIILSLFLAVLASLIFATFYFKDIFFQEPQVADACPKTEKLIIGQKPDPAHQKTTEEQLKNVNSILFKLLQTNSKASGQKVRDLLKERKTLLVGVARENPTLALGALLPEAQRSQLAKLHPGCVESRASAEGTLEVMQIEFDQDSKFRTAYYYTLVTAENDRIYLHPAKVLKQDLVSGQKVKVSGYKLDSDLLFDATEKNSLELIGEIGLNFFWDKLFKSASAISSPDAIGAQRLVNIVVGFQDVGEPNLTKAQINELTFNQMNNYFNEVSYGKVPSITGDTFGPYPLPINQTCDVDLVTAQSMQAANSEVDFTKYNSVMIYAPFSGCGWSGLSTVGKRNWTTPDGVARMSVSWVRPNSTVFNVMAHEYGHQLTMGHAGILNCGNASITSDSPAGCSFYEYGDWFDIMGSSSGHVNAFNKEWTNWFDPVNVKTVTSSGTYSIEPIETKTTGIKTLKILRAVDNYLYIEYRQPIGADASIGWRDVFNGALLHTNFKPSYFSYLLTSYLPFKSTESYYTPQFNVGQTFIDPITSTNIKVLSKTSNLLTLDIKIAEPPDTTPPTVLITKPVLNSTVNGSITVSADASDNREIAKVDFYDLYDNKLLNTIPISPYSFTWDTTKIPNGTHTLYAIAYDGAGNNTYSQNVPITVNNSFDTTPPTVSITNPLSGATVEKLVNITAQASDDTIVSKVEFYIDGSLSGVYSTAPYAHSWDTSALLPGSTHTIFTKAYDPAGNISVSSGISVNIKATDTTKPTVTITNPIDSGYVIPSTSVTISANATDNVGITKVEFYADSNLLCQDATAPYLCSWSVPGSGFSSHLIRVLAYDEAGNTTAAQVTVKVDTELPLVSILSPLNDSEITSSTTNPITVDASDNVSIAKVELFVDSILMQTSTTPPYSLNWNTQSLSPGSSHQIYVKAYDTSDNTRTSAIINVKIKAEPTPTPTIVSTPPTVSIIKPTSLARLVPGSEIVLEAKVTDNPNIEKVDFYLNFNKVCSVTSLPFSCNGLVPTADVSMYYLQAIVYYYAGSISTPIVYAYPTTPTPTLISTPTPTLIPTSAPTSTPTPLPIATPTPSSIPGSAQNPWKSETSGYVSKSYSNQKSGYRFTPTIDGKITKLGGYFYGSKTVNLYDASGNTVLAQVTVFSNNNWVFEPITPITITAGTYYIVGVDLKWGGGTTRSGISLPKTYDNIRILSSCTDGGTGYILANCQTTRMFGQVDIEFAPE